jgi:hypothetical protein
MSQENNQAKGLGGMLSGFMDKYAMPLGIAASIGSSIFGAIKGRKAERRAARKMKKEKKKMKELEDVYKNLDTSNPYLNMENTMEDLTVNQQQADFERQSFQQTQANIMSNLSGAAGGSGIANLAQSLAQQGQIAGQKQSASIGQQERANQTARQQMAGQIQLQERQGEMMSRDMKREQTSTLLGMQQQKFAAAADARAAAKEAKMGAIGGGIMGAAKMFAGFDEDQSFKPGGIFDEAGFGTGNQNIDTSVPNTQKYLNTGALNPNYAGD